MLFEKEKAPLSRTSMTGECSEKVGMLKRGVRQSQLNDALLAVCPAYQDFLPIKPAQRTDVQSLLQHVNLPPSVTFYGNLKSSENADEGVCELE